MADFEGALSTLIGILDMAMRNNEPIPKGQHEAVWDTLNDLDTIAQTTKNTLDSVHILIRDVVVPLRRG